MKSKLCRILLTMFIGLIPAVAAIAQSAGEPAPDKREPAKINPRIAQTDSDQKTALLLPEVEGWVRSAKTKYPVASLGYSYTYRSPKGGTVTVYIYHGGNRSIPDDINEKIVVEQFESAKDELKLVAKAGIYQNLKIAQSKIVTIGESTDSHFAEINFTVQGKKVYSELYLFVHDNNFIKIRATRDPEEADGEEFKLLLKELIAGFEQ